MSNVVRAPRGYFRTIGETGFSSGLSLAGVEKPHHAEEVAQLYDVMRKGLVDQTNFNFKMMVVETGATMFQNFDLWLALNASSNDYIYDLNWKLVEDTVQFLRDGTRSVSLHTMKDLILSHPEARRGVATPRRLSALKLKPNEFENAVAMWCEREDGLVDMLKTMNLFFGRVD